MKTIRQKFEQAKRLSEKLANVKDPITHERTKRYYFTLGIFQHLRNQLNKPKFIEEIGGVNFENGVRQLHKIGQIVQTYFDKKGFSCQMNKDQKHTEKRIGKVTGVSFVKERNTFNVTASNLRGGGFFIAEQENLIYIDTHPENIKRTL